MNNKYVSHWLSWVVPLGAGFATGAPLIIWEKDLSKGTSVSLSVLIALLMYIITEWGFFKDKLEKKLEVSNDIGSILNEFAEANLLIHKMKNTVESDLKFDNQIKKDKKHLEFHLYLSKLKYDEFFSSHFVFSPNKRAIQKIPRYYFERDIWRKLVGISDCYYSLQLLDYVTKDFYLKDKARLKLELTFLTKNLVSSDFKLQIFHKLFVLNDEVVDIQKKTFVDKDVEEYLKDWHDKFNDSAKVHLKIIRSSDAQGALDGKLLNDLGIFGNILGIQSVCFNKETDFTANGLRFDFYFDMSEVEACKKNFNAIFNMAVYLNEFFKRINDNSKLK